MSKESNKFLKTAALIATGALIGYAFARGRTSPQTAGKTLKQTEEKINLHKLDKSERLKKLLEAKLKDYPARLERNFINLEETNSNDTKKFRFMQWNILARSLAERYSYTKAPVEVYDWSNYRLWRTIDELTRYNSDIICVQEIDAYEEIKHYLHSLGYTSVFAPKYSSPCSKKEENYGPDGCAIFYRLSMFRIQNMTTERIIVDDEVSSQICLILQLRHKLTDKLLTIVGLHLKAGLNHFDRRECQIKEILKSVKIHLKGSNLDLETHPLIICGDLNGIPSEKFYDLIVNDQDISELRDAYSEIAETKEPTLIVYGGTDVNFIKIPIDYIFYNKKSLKLLSYLELPKNDELIEEQGLPNLKHSSDHLSIACDLKFN